MNKPTIEEVHSAAWSMERLKNISGLTETLENVHTSLLKQASKIQDELIILDEEVIKLVRNLRKEEKI